MKKLLMALVALPMAVLASTTWFVDGTRGSNGFSGLTTFAPKKTIQAAINAAAPGDYVMVAGGVYYENLTLSKRLTLFAYEPATPIVNGRLAGHCLLITENASGCVVDGFCFEKGAPTNSGNRYGGGIDCLANATIRHCTFRDNGNSSTTFAGGLHTSNGAQVQVENCLFVNNYAWACGGATLTEGNSTAIFDRCTVYGNKSDDYIGNEGGISVANSGTVIVRSCILWGNTGMQLAAYGSYYGAQSTIRVSYSCVQGGVAANGAGHFYNDGGNISTNPIFLDIPRRNFWFHDNSPCWRKGHPDYFEADGMRLHMGFWASRIRPLPPPLWQVEITLNAQDGDCCVPSVKRNVGDFVGLLPIPQREGYDFLGWFDKAADGRQIFPAEKVLVNRTFYAHWQQKIPPLFQVFGSTSGISALVKLGMTLQDGAADGKLYLNPVASQPIDEQTPLTSFESESSEWLWQPQKTGQNVFVYKTGDASVTTKVNVAKLTFETPKDPNPPMVKDPNVSITPVVRTIDANGAGKSIIVQGRGNWTAAVSDPWIVLGATSGTIPEEDGLDYVAYTVSVNTNIGQRVGYVYVNGYVHTITQAGHGQATLSTDNITCECEGGSADVDIDFTGRYAWDARPNDDWITVTPTHGTGAGTISCSIAPLNEVATRQGSITIGDMTVTVFQYGRRMKLYPVSEARDYYTHVIPIDVAGLALTTWDVTPNASWISVVDAGRGKGSDTVTIAIGENPSWRARSGTVTIGTETFTVTQEGRTDLEFSIDPVATTASVNGANGHIAVTGTPDLPWSVESKANWLTVLGSTASGSGNGNVFYTASPNSTLLERTGTIVITPADKSLQPVTHTVRQPGAVAVLSPAGYTFEADGEAADLTITVPGAVEWSIDESLDWLSVQGSLSRVGSGTVTLQALPNNTVFSRSGTVRIAERDITVTQKGREFEIDYEDTVFGTDGDLDSFSVYPDGAMAWKAIASDSWIKFMYGSDEGDGPGEVIFTVGPYVGDGTIRTGYIQIGEQKVLITQRAYDLSISPKAAVVSGNAGAGEISVSAGIDDVWHAIRTEPWIIIEEGTETGTGSGKVRFTFTDNDTGKTRSGKIIIDGEAYTLTQMARVVVNIEATVLGHGSVEGAGVHSMGEQVTLTAVPDDGYAFAYWTGDVGETMQNPIKVTADVAKSVTATFTPLTPEFISAVSSTDGVTLTWKNLAWAAEYRIYRAPSSEIPSAPLATLTADGTCTWQDTTGELEKGFWYWVVAVGADAETESVNPVTGKKQKPIVISKLTYENLRGATHTNPSTYQEETTVALTPPSALTGYTFAGWDPAAITADMTGDIVVYANWTPNTYKIVYYANGGSGTMADTACTYDVAAMVAANGFVRTGHTFVGWATTPGGEVAYTAGQSVTNLTTVSNGVVPLYAVWQINTYFVNGEEVEYGTNKRFVAPAATVDADGTTQYVTLGTSAYPDKGADFTLVITDDVNFRWDIVQTNFWLEAEPPENGTIQKDGEAYVDQWIAAGETVELTAVPDADYEFTAWYGETDGCTAEGAVLSVVMTKPRVVGATFVYAPQITEVAPPVITPADGATFSGAFQAVEITCATDGAAIYFTTNGTTPKASAKNLYTEPFTIADTTTIKAVAVYGDLKSGYATATITKVVPVAPADPVITPADGASFVGDSQIVTIDCATPGATIYYSTNGSTPKTTEANKYTGPFQITDTTTVKAVALKDGLKSAYVTAVITKRTLTLADAVGAPDLTFTTGGDADWKGVADATAKVGTTSARSGAITDEQTTWVETTVTGSGTFSFWWKVSCEDDPISSTWDHLEVSVDGQRMASIDGITDWAKISYDLEGEAGETHTIRWTYTKEASDLDGEDCAWIDGVVWASAAPTPIVVDDPNGKIVIPPGTDPATLDIKIMSNGYDIRSYLDLPAVKNGEIDLSQATVKEEIVKEALTGEGSEVTLDAANPTITTAKTIPGLIYTFREATFVESLSGKAPLTHPGDGKTWTPKITVKGGASAFYSIGVTK